MKLLKCILMVFMVSIITVGPVCANEVEQTMAAQLAVNINTATVEQLAALPGIGEKKAQMIIAYREEHGAFTRKEQLIEVKGLGKKLLAKIQDKIVLE